MSAHRTLKDLYKAFTSNIGPGLLQDPGDAGAITVDMWGQICELVSSGAETRTLATPNRPGVLAIIRMKTDGGDITLTAAGTLNVAANNTAVFGDVGDQLVLTSVSASSGYRWEILINTGSVALSTV